MVFLGAAILLIQDVRQIDVLGVWEAQLGVPPNIHCAQQDLCEATKPERPQPLTGVSVIQHSQRVAGVVQLAASYDPKAV